MLKLIRGGRVAPGQDAASKGAASFVRSLPAKRPEPGEMLESALRNKAVDETCRSLVETYDSAGRFALKLVTFLTDVYPSTTEAYPNALCEILDLATVAYLRIESVRDPKDTIATFLATGIAAATSAVMAYSTSQERDRKVYEWDPWEDGDLSGWLCWGKEVHFSPEFAPTQERRYATRGMLLQKLLRMKDAMAIARAGIDMQSMFIL